MSTLGKILIVVQVIMSILFMCAAGAVYTVQRNWQDQYNTAQTTFTTQRQAMETEIEELNTQVTTLRAEVAEQTNRADEVVGRNDQLAAQNQDLTRRLNSLEQQLSVETAVSEKSNAEAGFRQEEAEQQRIVNRVLHQQLNGQIDEIVQLRDQVYTLQVDNDNMNEQIIALLDEVGFLTRVVTKHGLSTDRREVEGLSDPPPPVEGLVLETRKDRTNRPEFAHISLGSDDGLLIGHELDVIRTAERNGGQSLYLGRIRIVHLLPNEAVGVVVDAARSGIIEEGDNVTTRL